MWRQLFDELIEAIDGIKGSMQTLILSNSATLADPKIFSTLLKLDQVKLSLDAVTPDVFKKIDRPHEGIEVSEVVAVVRAFSKAFKGELFIEILFVQGLNDTTEEIQELRVILWIGPYGVKAGMTIIMLKVNLFLIEDFYL